MARATPDRPKAKKVANIKIPTYRKPRPKKLVPEVERPARLKQLQKLISSALLRMSKGGLDAREHGQHASKVKEWKKEQVKLKGR